MRYALLLTILFVVLFVSCSKEKNTTSPTLKFKSVNTTQLHNQELIYFTLAFTDPQGNLFDSIYVDEVVPNCPASNIDGYFPVPSFPASKNQKGDIVVTLGYNVSGYTSISPQCQENDTAVFRFAVRDLNNNTSDTVSSPPIILYYQ
jgi:hypothetical protein